ncbi:MULTISPECIES: phosphoadenosine phosphosulfate reductase family protein [Pseudomonas]|uniref:phosphoadenosine phosphosulfate reductase domain-containing protein n=1 Tax=Pseudomonas TaxID=286 RepID=UPI001AE9DDEE|nr:MULTISPECIES: phosphoadenosine phosphosulfate reductase family protein [Pseudomonas]MBP2086375.1 3'-phosphoadenosine 5'-phosphosulfate sulfotransferase (PAPS reductase)/FAD synthetase [Pseudomonas sp. PvP089]MBP2092638.1 3'-phosphoadenosine 5'-phosphosulfate sulfotransferase (PAPS reductase)/FAD synthetase [Pseudomonas sp. PvP088]MBP2226544.1 3'-phosphoadenosine 5'-phosphosulfate sulfotransferase (PAPS reductase)/FAD synthetase [Pseudomonas putida]
MNQMLVPELIALNDYTHAIPALDSAGRFARIVARAEACIARIDQIIDQGFTCSSATSFGKDSTVVLVLMLEAIRRRVEAGLYVPAAFVTNANTGTENPGMDIYAEAMITELEMYCTKQRLPITVVKVQPSMTSTFAYATLGRGKLPVFAGASRSCSIDWKLRPQQKALKQLLSTLQSPGELVTFVGTRLSESATRAANMRERGEEEAGRLVLNEHGSYNCSIIADWEMEEVWEFLMACEAKRGGPYRTFVDNFDWCLELYKEANEGTCAIITGDGGNKAACGSRFGCAWCTVTGERDKSMEAMIASAPEKHGHMSGINRFRNHLINTRWDMGRRDWIGRTHSDAGYINVTGTAYNAEMRRELLRYLLTLDVLEEERAEEHDARMFRGELERTESNEILRGVTFQFITAKNLLAIDFAWSLSYGFDHAFPALSEWYEIRVLGKRYLIDDVTPVEKGIIPEQRWFKFDDWQSPAQEMGLQDAYLEATNKHRYPGRPAMRTIRDRFEGKDRNIVYYEEAAEMEIDPADAMCFVDEFDDAFYTLAKSLAPTDRAKFYLNNGMVKLAKGKAAEYDAMARRAQFWQRMARDLAGTDLRSYIRHHSISNAEHEQVLESMKVDSAVQNLAISDLFA